MTEDALARTLPAVATELRGVLQRLEQDFGDVQDVEFTIENARLWILQTRAAKRTARAVLKIAVDLVHEGLITEGEAVRRVSELDATALVETRLAGPAEPALRGVGASGGIAVGRVAFDSESAKRLAATGEPVILVRPDISTADVAGFAVSAGIVTAVGGRTAHAALVARQMAKPCVVGCSGLIAEASAHRAQFAGSTIAEGDWISVDGDKGNIYLGRHQTTSERPEAEMAEVARWRESNAERLVKA